MNPRTSGKYGCAVLAGLACFATSTASAQSSAPPSTAYAQGLLDNPFVIDAGTFIMSSNIKASLDNGSADNPEINFDDTFGKSNRTSRVRLDATWRINPRHHLRFGYFDDSRGRKNVLDHEVVWGNETYRVGGEVKADTSVKVYELSYEYAFVRQPTYEINGSAGLHYTDLSGVADVLNPDGSVDSGKFSAETASASAPLPVIGVRAGWVVAPQVYLDAQAQLFKVNLNGVDGHWSDLRVGGIWMFSPHLGVGLGYNRFDAKVTMEKTDFKGRANLNYSGLQAYLTATF